MIFLGSIEIASTIAFAKPKVFLVTEISLFLNKKIGFIVGSVCVCILRFLCSFLSGWLLWGSYAPEGMNAAYYSLVYNGAYMLPDTIILAVVVAILAYTIPKLFWAEE